MLKDVPLDREVDNIIHEYKKNLEASGIKVKAIFLYGSCALEKYTEESDIDLVVVSDDFKDMDLWERLCFLGRARRDIKKPMDILGVTEDEFSSECPGTFIGDEVKAKGREVVQGNLTG